MSEIATAKGADRPSCDTIFSYCTTFMIFAGLEKRYLDHMMCFERYSERNHEYYYHYMREPVTDTLRKINFHVVVLSTSALAFCRYCHPRGLFHRFRDAWSFIGELNAVKLAFPQDDYHRTNDIDELLHAWGVDVVYTVLPEFASKLYPLSMQVAEVKEALTGYVDDSSIVVRVKSFKKPFDERRSRYRTTSDNASAMGRLLFSD